MVLWENRTSGNSGLQLLSQSIVSWNKTLQIVSFVTASRMYREKESWEYWKEREGKDGNQMWSKYIPASSIFHHLHLFASFPSSYLFSFILAQLTLFFFLFCLLLWKKWSYFSIWCSWKDLWVFDIFKWCLKESLLVTCSE